MEIMYFLMFVAVGLGFIMWAGSRSSKKRELEAKRARQKSARSKKLHTQHDDVPGHPAEIWHTRRHAAAKTLSHGTGFIATQPSSDSDSEYDGYSRRDRHRIVRAPVQVKEEGAADELAMTAVEFKTDDKAASG